MQVKFQLSFLQLRWSEAKWCQQAGKGTNRVECHDWCDSISRYDRFYQMDLNGTLLDVEATVYYLGDMLYSGRYYDSAIATRCCVAWRKFRKLFTVLTTRHLSPKCVPRCLHPASVRCSTLAKCGDQILWPPASLWSSQWPHAMIFWTWGTNDREETQKLGYHGIPSQSVGQMVWTHAADHVMYPICCRFCYSQHERAKGA